MKKKIKKETHTKTKHIQLKYDIAIRDCINNIR